MRDAQAKAAVLIEALPYIRRWSGKTVVVKVGGEVLDDERNLDSFATDITLLRFVGMNPIVVHGGGKQISEAMRSFGKEPSFVGGHRVTDAETVGIVRMVLMGQVNKTLVAAMNGHGGRAAGISGEDGALLTARKVLRHGAQDLGFVGEVESVNTSILETLVASEFIPVVAPFGSGPGGAYNINADLAAGAIAGALGAEKVVFLTNVEGLYHDLGDSGSLISETSVDQLKKLLDAESLSAGMIPKIQSAVAAIEAGVKQAHILDGRVQHALLVEIFTDEGAGTMVLP